MWPKSNDGSDQIICNPLMTVKRLSQCQSRRSNFNPVSRHAYFGRDTAGFFPVSNLLFPANYHLRANSTNNLLNLRALDNRRKAEQSANILQSPFKTLRNGFKLYPTVNAAESPTATTSDTSPVVEQPDPKPSYTYEIPPGQTGWDRLREMYTSDVYGELGPEWSLVKQGFEAGIIVGVIAGVLVGGREARLKHLDTTHADVYTNEMAGRRALQDKMTLGMFRGGYRWGWRTCVFTTMYIGIATHMSVYRGSTSVVDFTVAGAVVGSAFKFMQGPRAALTAGIVGCVLGLVSGSISLGVLKLSGISMEQIRYEHYQLQPKVRSEIQGRFYIPDPPPNEGYKPVTSATNKEQTATKVLGPELKSSA